MTEQQTSTPEQTVSAVWPDWQKQIVGVVLLLLIPVTLYFLRPVLGPILVTFALTFILMYPIRFLAKWLKLPLGVSMPLVSLMDRK